MKLYDQVKDLLVKYPELRSSDKKLLWAVWTRKGLVTESGNYRAICKEDFYKSPSSESVTRARRKVQENFPALQATPQVQDQRNIKEQTKGTFVYREET